MLLTFATSGPRQRRFGCVPLALTVSALCLLVVAVLLWLARSAPTQWHEIHTMIEEMPQAEREKVADALQSQFVNEAQGIVNPATTPLTPSHPREFRAFENRVIERSLSIPIRDANIWLATNLKKVLAFNDASMPAGVTDPRVWVEDSQLVMSVRLSLGAYSGVVSMGVSGEMRPDGKMLITLGKARAGKLRVSSGLIADELKAELLRAESESTRRFAEAFEGIAVEPVWDEPGDGGGGRQIRILDFKIHPDRIELKIRNGPREAPAPPAKDP